MRSKSIVKIKSIFIISVMDFDDLYENYSGVDSAPEDEDFYESDSDEKVDLPKHLIKVRNYTFYILLLLDYVIRFLVLAI